LINNPFLEKNPEQLMKHIFFIAGRLRLLQMQFLVFPLLIILASPTEQASAGEGITSVDHAIDIAWSENNADRIAIFLCTRKQGKWSKPERITDYTGDSLHPTVDRDVRGNIWLTWTSIDFQNFQIRYAVKQKGQWSDPKIIATKTENNIAPFLMLDHDGIPWVVWTGNNDDDDDIYYSRFVHGNWQKPQLVHSDNDVPDILPRMDLDASNKPQVTWEHFTPAGYTIVSKIWDGNSWIDENNTGKTGLGKSNEYKKQSYSVAGRVWDGRQWIKKASSKDDPSRQQDPTATRKDTNVKQNEIQLPPFVQNVKNIYIRIYQ
jgi:hypothetical protein